MKLKISFLISILVIIFSYSNIYTQDLEPTQRTFTIGGHANKKLDNTNNDFKFDKFVLGWQWGANYKLSQVLKMNHVDVASGETHKIKDSSYLFIRPIYKRGTTDALDLHTHNTKYADPMLSKSIKYEPTLSYDPNNEIKLIKRDGDPSNPVFGFKFRHDKTTVFTSNTNTDYSRVIVDNIVDTKDEVVLSNVWPNNVMTYTPVITSDENQLNYFGRGLYVSINLKRYGTINESTNNVLKIEIPYLYCNNAGVKQANNPRNAKFDRVPGNTTSTLASGYGKIRSLREINENNEARPDHIIITKDMLPSDGSSITISGFIDFSGIKSDIEITTKH
jgi:hypothetical protein